MKKYIKYTFIFLLTLYIQSSFAQKKVVPEDTTIVYFNSLLNSGISADTVLLESKLYDLLRSGDEEDWFTAENFFYQLKKNIVVDSIQAAQRIKFPAGMEVRNDQVKKVYDENDAVKKEEAYKAWIRKFPPEKFGKDRIEYDYARNAVSTAYAKVDNIKKAVEYANMVETPVWKGEGWAGPANILAKEGHLNEAAMLLRKAAANSYKYMTTNRTDAGAEFAATGYVSYCSSLADILYKQKKYTEALKYIKQAHDSSDKVRGNVNATYANVLMALGRNKEAFEKINEAIKDGQATDEMKANLKTLYVKVKGSNKGYADYLASLNKILEEKIKREVAKKIIDIPAAMFNLKDVNGNTVSLADLKGKVVVLDFWATWCGPCKRSFPAMKMALNKYKNDPDVKFLFIHTWERDSTATLDAKKYVTDNNYPFEVLMDLKNPATGLNEAVEAYKVSAIPAKFIIDKNGNIRFKLSGFEGGNDAAVEEISAMIELAKTK